VTDYGRSNLIIQTGTDWQRVVTYRNPDGTLFNLTGYEARMQVRPAVLSETTILSLTSDPAAGITMGGALGTITLDIANADLTEGDPGLDLSACTHQDWLLEAFDDGTATRGYGPLAVWDLELITPAGKVDRIVQGQVCFDREVTR